MLGNLTGWHLLIILAVVLLIFGAAKLPALAKSMGQSARILKSEIAAGKAESAASDSVSAGTDPVAQPATPAASSAAVSAAPGPSSLVDATAKL